MHLAAILAAAALASAQAPKLLTFEVASVRLSPPMGDDLPPMSFNGGPGTLSPTRFSSKNVPLVRLLRAAYDIDVARISGPPWLRDSFYHVEATMPAGTTSEQFRQMLQALLTERLQMTVHFEKREMQIYELAAAKGGPKLRESSPEAAVPPSRLPYPPRFRSIVPLAKRTMSELAQALAALLQQPVLDATGLPGRYDTAVYFTRYSARDATAAAIIDGSEASPAPDAGPDLFEAVRAQLGLELKARKAPVDVLVVDRAERIPTEN